MQTKDKQSPRIDPALRKLLAQTWLVQRGYTAAQSKEMWHMVRLHFGDDGANIALWFCGHVYNVLNPDDFTFGMHDLQLLDKYRAPAPKAAKYSGIKGFFNGFLRVFI